MSEVRLEHVSKRYGDFVAVDDLTLAVQEGEFLTLLGPSGCGKTTTLRMIAGFVQPDTGSLKIGSTDVSRVPPYRRNIGMVFQSYALFPHLTVAENVAYGLRIRKVASAEIRSRVAEALDLVQLAALAGRYPSQMSGGQQQRVALARAVVIRPDILLLDEPIGALDLKLRQELQVEIKRVQEQLGITTLYVTHDQGEALSLSDRIAVMKGGRIVQLDRPNRLYSQPVNAYVANFIGKTNMLEGEVIDRSAHNGYTVRLADMPDRSFSVARATDAQPFEAGARCLLAFRPERASLTQPLPNRIEARVNKVSYYGTVWSVSLSGRSGCSLLVECNGEGGVPNAGDDVQIAWHPQDCFLLPTEPN